MRITLGIPVTSSSSHPAEDGLLCCWKPISSVLSHKLGQDDFLPNHLSHYCWPQNFFLYPDVIHDMKPFFSSRESSLQRRRKLFSVNHLGCLWLQTTFVTRCASVMGELLSGPPELGFMTRRLLLRHPTWILWLESIYVTWVTTCDWNFALSPWSYHLGLETVFMRLPA